MLGIVGLIFLIISLLQRDMALLRGYGIVSCLFMLVQYINDIVLIVTNLSIIGCHYRYLYVSGISWRSLNDKVRNQIDQMLF